MMDEPMLEPTLPQDHPGQSASDALAIAEQPTIGPELAEQPTLPARGARPSFDLAEQPTLLPDVDEDATLPAKRPRSAGEGPDLTMTFVVARGQGETRSHLSPEGVDRVRNAFTPGGMLQGRYELGRELGRGGMGIVYLGRDVRLDRPVAIKAILAELGEGGSVDDRSRQAFAEEARLGANLTHPAIATVFDYGFHEGNPFAVFEFIPGMMLRDVLSIRRKLPVDEVRLIVGSLAQALDFAHERHVVHRDLKPENIRATEQGLYKVLDLGLAKDFHSHADWTFCGTPAYAAPEQASALPCDGRTDQYALAVIAFEMLTGTRPFESKSWVTLLEKHVSEPPPQIRAIQPDVPDAVEAALLKALSKNPNGRFATCTEFAVAIGSQLLSAPAPAVEVLLETTSKKMWGRWKSFNSPFALFSQPRVHLTLAPDALWGTYRGMLMRWPIGSITEAKARGRKLQLLLAVTKGKAKQTFKLRRRKESKEWAGLLDGLIAGLKPKAEAPELPAPAVDPIEAPKIDPVVLLKARPATRFQLLGPIDVKAPKRKIARARLAIRGVMMGADAVVDVQDERLGGVFKTEHRASGTAVRAVDREGKLELMGRWFEGQARTLGNGVIAMASFSLIGALSMLSTSISLAHGDVTAIPFVNLAGIAAGLWVFAISLAFRWLRWPQLGRSVAITFLGLASTWLISIVATLIGYLVLLTRGGPGQDLGSTEMMISSAVTALSVLSFLVSFSIGMFYLYIGRRAWKLDADYRKVVGDDAGQVVASRRVSRMVAFGCSILYAIWAVGISAVTSYNSAGVGTTIAAAITQAQEEAKKKIADEEAAQRIRNEEAARQRQLAAEEAKKKAEAAKAATDTPAPVPPPQP